MSSFDLTTIAQVKEYLGIAVADTSKDDILTNIVTAVSDEIAIYCGRQFELDTYTQQINGNGESSVRLTNTPIEGILYAAMGRCSLIKITYNGVLTGMIQVVSKEIRLTEGLSQTDVAIGDNDTIADVATNINAQANWSAEVVSSTLEPYPGRILTQRTYEILEPTDCTNLYGPTSSLQLREESDGFYLANRAICDLAIVIYNGGYAVDAIPVALEQLATQIASDVYKTIGQQANLKSEKIGDYSYMINNVTPSIMAAYQTRLDYYKEFTV